jgi:hypothetical protein
MAMSCHRVRECIAARIFFFTHIYSAEHFTDIFSEHWGYNQVWETLKGILFSFFGT